LLEKLQTILFRSRLDAREADRFRLLEEKLGGRQQPLPTPLIARLAIFKHAYDLPNEVVCEQWAENP
jgi:hypothetical protein